MRLPSHSVSDPGPPPLKPQLFSVGAFSRLMATVPACSRGFIRRPADFACCLDRPTVEPWRMAAARHGDPIWRGSSVVSAWNCSAASRLNTACGIFSLTPPQWPTVRRVRTAAISPNWRVKPSLSLEFAAIHNVPRPPVSCPFNAVWDRLPSHHHPPGLGRCPGPFFFRLRCPCTPVLLPAGVAEAASPGPQEPAGPSFERASVASSKRDHRPLP
jgi:hypothetical protein